MEIILKGNPISTNQLYRSANRGGRCIRYMTKKGKERKENYRATARLMYGGEPYDCDLMMTVVIFFGDKRRRDIDNYNKVVLDSLEGICYNDDKQIQTMFITKAYDKEDPRIEILIEEQI